MQVRAGEEPLPAGAIVAVSEIQWVYSLRSRYTACVAARGVQKWSLAFPCRRQSAGLHFVGVVGAHVRVISLGISRENY